MLVVMQQELGNADLLWMLLYELHATGLSISMLH